MGIKDQLDLPDAAAWRPEPGEQVIGKVIGIDERDGDYGTYPLVTILAGDGIPLAVHGFHSVLRNELGKLAPSVGDEIGISYRGLVESKGGGNAYESYKVVLERGDGTAAVTPDWGKHQAEAEAELSGDEEPF